MNKILLFVVLAWIIQVTASSQCLPEGITFSTQVQIDNFQTNFPNCTEIEGNVIIKGSITNLNGLNVLTSIGGNLNIYGTDALNNLVGLENMTSIGGNLIIGSETYGSNKVLTNLLGLKNVASIGGFLSISYNDSLTSLTGLEKISAASISHLMIFENMNLDSCNTQNICNYLVKPNGKVVLFNNASGCNNPPEIAKACGFKMPCLPYGTYYLMTQTDIDNFQTDYLGCTEIEGNVYISGEDIINLNGLNVLTSIGGSLLIISNELLTNLTGLENVTFIGGDLNIEINKSLTNLNGLDNLDSIGNRLLFYYNPVLNSLTGLRNLTTIGGDFSITYTNVLTSLEGLGNINAKSISNLYITHNPSLSTCNIRSICEFLANPNGNIVILDNTLGCNNMQEIENNCLAVGVQNVNVESAFSFHPNPARKELHISNKNGSTIKEVTIFNQFGQKVLHLERLNNTIDISMLKQGWYIVELVSSTSKTREKLIIE